MFNLFSNAHPREGLFEAVIVIIGESGAGKSRLIDLIAGKPITDTPKSTGIQEYTCTYQDKDTYFTWKLHLLDTPGFVNNHSDRNALYAIWQRLRSMERRLFNTISGIIYCHNINQGPLTDLASRLMRTFMDLHGDQVMKNVILCTTHWDMLVDESVGERSFRKLKEYHWNEMLDLGARMARHRNTHKSVKEILGLIVGKEALKFILLEELGRPEMTVAGKAAFKKNYWGTKRLLEDIRNTQINEVADRAEVSRRDAEYCWQQNLAHMSAELDSVKMAQEKRAMESRIGRKREEEEDVIEKEREDQVEETIKWMIKKEKENQAWKRKMWEVIRRAREERIEKGYAELCRRLAEATDTSSLAKINTEEEESRWQQKLAHMLAELDKVKTVHEKETIEWRIENEMEDRELKRKLGKAIQMAREERIEGGNAELCRREATGLKFIANPARATYNKVGDALVSGVKLLERALPGDRIRIWEQKQGHSSKTAVGLSGSHSSHIDNPLDGDTSSENNDDFVPLQFKPFTGKYTLTPSLASKKFQNDDADLLLDALNKIFDTNIPISYPGVQKTLEYLIKKGHDLGSIYAHMQVIWPMASTPSILSESLTDDNSNYIIGSPQLASRKCHDVDELLTFLNMSFNTKIPRSMPGISKVLRFLLDQGYEFGRICAHLCYTWPRTSDLEWEWLKVWKFERMTLDVWEDFLTLERRGTKYEDQRRASLYHGTSIHDPDLIKPRRIWDLYAHRLIPFQFSVVDANSHNYDCVIPARVYLRFGSTRLGRYHPVSHSWTEDMSPVDSPVNAHEWPIPLPRGVTLEAIRNELLNLGAQYVWLDVVCLRQASSDPACEALRMEEWKIDVPTIGKIYEASPSVDNVIRYLNGLGKAFRRDGWHDERHWSQRAWTLQEVNGVYIEAGLPKGVEDPLEETDNNGTLLRDHLKTREIKLPFQPGKGFGQTNLHNTIAAMKGRYSQNPVDKIFGLSLLLECKALLAYSEDEGEEDAWARLISHVSSRILAELLFACPLPGENGCYWRPSWRQLMTDANVIKEVPSFHLASSKLVGNRHLLCRVALIEGCQVSFNFPSVRTVIKTERKGKKYEWTMINLNLHTEHIVSGNYTLAGCSDRPSLHWVLCKRHSTYGELEKVSVLHRSPEEIRGSDVIGRGLNDLLVGRSDLMNSEEVIFL